MFSNCKFHKRILWQAREDNPLYKLLFNSKLLKSKLIVRKCVSAIHLAMIEKEEEKKEISSYKKLEIKEYLFLFISYFPC